MTREAKKEASKIVVVRYFHPTFTPSGRVWFDWIGGSLSKGNNSPFQKDSSIQPGPVQTNLGFVGGTGGAVRLTYGACSPPSEREIERFHLHVTSVEGAHATRACVRAFAGKRSASGRKQRRKPVRLRPRVSLNPNPFPVEDWGAEWRVSSACMGTKQ